jgi:hypothetical protein
MAGGIFPGAPFRFNIKCIIFTACIAGGYWFLPPKNLLILALLLWLPYIAMAWYDYSYECRNKLKPTIVPFGRYLWLPFKPKEYQDEFLKMSDSQIQAMNTLDHITGWTLFIILVIGLLSRSKKLKFSPK